MYTLPIEAFKSIETPFYYYDMDLLRDTLNIYNSHLNKHNYVAHYAVKANAEKPIEVTVSGNSIEVRLV